MMENKAIDSNYYINESRETFKDYLMQMPNFLTLFLVPIIFMSIGSVLIEMAKDLGTTPENINLIFTFFPIGMIAGQLTSVFYNRRFKRAVIIIIAYAFLIAINVTFFFARHISVFFTLYVVGGYLIGINYIQSTENLLACKIKNKDRLFFIMLSFYPIGALIAPLISSSLVKNEISWRFTYLISAGAILITMVLYILISLNGQNRIIAAKTQKILFREVFVERDKNFIFIMILLVAAIYCTAETVIATWAPTYLRLAKNMDIQSAALSITFFQTFTVLGRFIASVLTGKVKVKTILITISGLAFISIIFFVLSKSRFFLFANISLAGLGFSAMYPLLVSSGSTIYEKGRGILASLIFASLYIGKTMAPFITKKIAETNLTFSITVALVFSGVSSLIIIFLIIYERIKSRKTCI
ncbi:MAG: MFS transporter [Cyanobacteria bacterium]|nr:MFS transporter [Cyanobacteriota bacterium]